MRKYVLFASIALLSLQASAVNITVNDGSGTGTGWYSPHRENQEVEPGCVATQPWDLESMDLTFSSLTLQGGYKFSSPSGYGGFKPGDIFIDIDSDSLWDFVVDINDVNVQTYKVIDVRQGGAFITNPVHYAQNAHSNPWKYSSGGVVIDSGDVIYGTPWIDSEGTHYSMTVDIASLDPFALGNVYSTVHYTMECGNDNLIGKFWGMELDPPHNVPDGGSTALMSFIGLLGLVGMKRRV